MRYYRVDVLDFYRGELSARRLAVLLRQLPPDSALSRAMNGGQVPLSQTDHFLADLWALLAKKDHPVRAEVVAKARNARKVEKHKRMQAKHRNMLSAEPIHEGSDVS